MMTFLFKLSYYLLIEMENRKITEKQIHSINYLYLH